jgi:hypothetical protein
MSLKFKNILDECEWLIIRNAATVAAAEDLESHILAVLTDNFGAPKARQLSDQSTWLMETEEVCPGTARNIREQFKSGEALTEKLSAPGLLSTVETLGGAKPYLHHIIRLRTVMKCHDFSHSRPHQDISLWPDRPNHINCWLPLCDIDDELAPLLIVPESSKKIFPHVENKYGQMEVASFDKQMLTSKKICARFGDLVMFSPKIIHFSAPNLTKTVRWSLDFRYQTSASG